MNELTKFYLHLCIPFNVYFKLFFIVFICRLNSDSSSSSNDVPKLKEGNKDTLDDDVKMRYKSKLNIDNRERDYSNEEEDRRRAGGRGGENRERERDSNKRHDKNNRNSNKGKEKERSRDDEEWVAPRSQVRIY